MSDDNGTLPLKRDVAESLLGKGSLFVHLDPRHEEARVPEWLRQQPQLVLQVGYNMTIAIPDLSIDDDCVFGTLSFSRTPFACYVPWEAVFALVGDDGRGMVWPESMPPEIAAEVDREAARAKRAARVRSTDAAEPTELGAHSESRDRHRTLTRIHEGDDAVRVRPLLSAARQAPAGAKRDTRAPVQKRRALPPYLRVVK
jgi:stringent starvation protein B